ncbi:hypothetical protein GOP47_0009075 [Adiantum capillus-veneris]|uniref:ALOG domain-containing protein n=1 Tax=Adiantum capillus-veneris TaxID=13818 RepID=A0A9D4UZJ2_ADICA|nr:hypothetical protein GOP47_0009075 [Adiantum capillus-veneris]
MNQGFDAGGSSFLDHGLLLPPEGFDNQSTEAPSAAAAAAPSDLAVPANSSGAPSRYESQKRRDWNTFGQYLRNHRPPLALAKCSGAHVLEFLRYLDQFGKTKVHTQGCPFFGHPQPPAPCGCPLRQAWGSLDALIGRLRAAYEEHGGKPESNPFGARAVRLYLREVRETQAKARGIAYEKKKRKKPPQASSCTSPIPPTTIPPPPPPPPLPPQSFPPPLQMDQFLHHHYLHPSLHQDEDFKQN